MLQIVLSNINLINSRYLLGNSEIKEHRTKLNFSQDSKINLSNNTKLKLLNLNICGIINKIIMYLHDKLNLSYKTSVCLHQYTCFQYVLSVSFFY